MDRVDYSKVEKDIPKLPKPIKRKFFLWVEAIEDERIGWCEIVRQRLYKDHKLKGKRSHQWAANLSVAYRVIYEVHQSNKINIINVERISKHDYK